MNQEFKQYLQNLASEKGLDVEDYEVGKNYTCVSQDHEDKNPSMTVYKSNALCRGCQTNFKIQTSSNKKTKESKSINQKIIEDVIELSQIEYEEIEKFAEQMGFKLDVVKSMNIGFFNKNVASKLNKIHSKIISKNKRIFMYMGREIIPYNKGYFSARKKNKDDNNLFIPGAKQLFFNKGTNDRLIICEGETDLIALRHIFPNDNLLSMGGSVGFGKVLEYIEKDFVKEVFFCYDNDEAGNNYFLTSQQAIKNIKNKEFKQIVFDDEINDIRDFFKIHKEKTLEKLKFEKVYIPKDNNWGHWDKRFNTYTGIEIRNGEFLRNDDNGIYTLKNVFNQQTKSHYQILGARIHYWHIETVYKIVNAYIDEPIYEINISNGKYNKTIKGYIKDLIEEFLKLAGCVDSNKFKNYFSTLIGHLETKTKLKKIENPLISAWGFCLIDRKIKEFEIEKNTKLKSDEADEKKLNNSLLKLNQLINIYAKTEEHKNDMLRIFALGLIYPFGYARKQNGSIAPLMIIKGVSGSGKTISSIINGCTWGFFDKRGIWEQSASSIAGAFQFARNMSLTTFPLTCNEAEPILSKFSEAKEITELHKNLIETTGNLREKKSGVFLGYRTPIYTCNYDLNIVSDALKCKIMVFNFGLDCKHTGEERGSMVKKIIDNEKELSFIGSWILKQVKENNAEYQKIILEKDYSKASINLMKKLYADAKIKDDLPEAKEIGHMEYAESTQSTFFEDFIDYLKYEIIDRAKKVNDRNSFEKGLDIETALDLIIEKNNLPSWMFYQARMNKILISHSAIQNLMKFTKKGYEISAFEKACYENNINYEKGKFLKINNKVIRKSGLYCLKQEFLSLFSNQVDDE